jgi:hypothetical protein
MLDVEEVVIIDNSNDDNVLLLSLDTKNYKILDISTKENSVFLQDYNIDSLYASNGKMRYPMIYVSSKEFKNILKYYSLYHGCELEIVKFITYILKDDNLSAHKICK